MTLRTFLCTLIFVCNIASAQTIVGMHLLSVHSASWLNNENTGAYVRLDNGATLGSYYNSMRRQTVYAGYTWEQANGPLALSFVGLTGYREGDSIQPAVVPSVHFHLTKHVAARLTLIYEPISGAAVHLSMEYRQ